MQAQPDPNLSRRMYTYAYRRFERYGTEVFGYAILAGGKMPPQASRPRVRELGSPNQGASIKVGS